MDQDGSSRPGSGPVRDPVLARFGIGSGPVRDPVLARFGIRLLARFSILARFWADSELIPEGRRSRVDPRFPRRDPQRTHSGTLF